MAALAALQVPLVGVLVLLAWRLRVVGFLSAPAMWTIVVLLAAALAVQVRGIVRVNRPALAGGHDAASAYPFRSVAILSLAYAVTFGSELAVVSMLPTFFGETFGLGVVAAGATASAYAVMNLVSRPAGGLCSDLLGSRKRTLLVLLCCLAGGYGLLAAMGPAWPLALAVVAVMTCSVFVQAGEGATFAIVPLVSRRVGGQISGIVGAYGNVGALLYLTLLALAGHTVFFAVIAGSALVAALACRWLPEPPDSFVAEHAVVGREPERPIVHAVETRA